MGMAADSTHYVKHIESFLDSSTSAGQQAASVDAIASLLRNDMLTLESLVREMEMYLTTTDSFLRARGVLLLAELLACLASKPLEKATVSSLIGFFTERLADWKALHGALVGSLALISRKGDVGIVSGGEALAVAQSFLENVQVQSLGQSDRKLCFELLALLLDRYPADLVQLGDALIFGVCESIDGEKDPQCLILTFHIVNVLAQLFPDPSGPLATFATDLFETLSCYFPIHFTHSKGEDIDVKKEELSRALMMAFASTPLFEPFAIPVLLEKLSSDLPSAKVESLKYLSYCTDKYGADRMEKHVKDLWYAMKDIIYTWSVSVLSLGSELLDGMSFQDSHVVKETLVLLEKIIFQNSSLLLDLIVSDEDINTTVHGIHQLKDYNDIPLPSKQKLHAVGCVLYLCAKTSVDSCNRVLESFFSYLVDALEISTQNTEDDALSSPCNFGAVYLCLEILAGCRALVVGLGEHTSIKNFYAQEAWCDILCNYSTSLTKIFSSILVISLDGNSQNAYLHYGVKGLQLLATFPGSSTVSKPLYEDILLKLMSVITLNFDNSWLWKLVLRALVEIGSFVDKSQDTEKAQTFDAIVVEKIGSFMSSDDLTLPSQLKLEAISSIGMAGRTYMSKILKGLERSLSACLSGVYVRGDTELVEIATSLMECYSGKVLPWLDSNGGHEEVYLHFVLNIWDQIETNMSFCIIYQEQKLLRAAMTAMQHAVGSCSEESQSIIVNRAFNIILSNTSFHMKDLINGTTPVKVEGLKSTYDFDCFSRRDQWIISLFASVIIALRPQTCFTNLKATLRLFLTIELIGHVPSAQALGSVINKLPVKVENMDTSKICSLEEAMDMIFSSIGWDLCYRSPLVICTAAGDINDIDLKKSLVLKARAIETLAWIGKGLLMRGHENSKDIMLAFFNCLLSNDDVAVFLQRKQKDSKEQELLSVMRAAADAFHILISDSEACLNRRFHATIRPLYKQRLFNIVLPVVLSSVVKADSLNQRAMLYRAFANVVCGTPLSAIVSEAQKLIPVLVESLSILSEDILNKDMVYGILLVLSGIVTDEKRSEVVAENAHIIIRRITALISYSSMMVIRETAIQCLTAMSELPHARIYPMRTQVLLSISKTLDDPKRAVRQAAVRCRQAWSELLDL